MLSRQQQRFDKQLGQGGHAIYRSRLRQDQAQQVQQALSARQDAFGTELSAADLRATEQQRTTQDAASAGQQVREDQERRLAAREAHGAVLQAKVLSQDAQIQKSHAELRAANKEAEDSFSRQTTAIQQASEATDSRLKDLERHAEHTLTLQAAQETKEVEAARVAAAQAEAAQAAQEQAAMYRYTLSKVREDLKEKFGRKRAAEGGAEDVLSGADVRHRSQYPSGGATGYEDRQGVFVPGAVRSAARGMGMQSGAVAADRSAPGDDRSAPAVVPAAVPAVVPAAVPAARFYDTIGGRLKGGPGRDGG